MILQPYSWSYLEKTETLIQKTYPDVHSTIYSSQDMEAT